jgi:hypothetical protein
MRSTEATAAFVDRFPFLAHHPRLFDWNQDINGKSLHELIGQREILDRNDRVESPTPETRAPGRRSDQTRAISRSGMTQPIRTGRYSSQIRRAFGMRRSRS